MKLNNLLFLDSGPNSAAKNMAIDESLLDCAQPVLRFYQWHPKAISIGRFQNLAELDLAYCQNHQIDIIKRPTGGQAVLHNQELTYCFVIDKNLMPKSILDSYAIISQALILGLSNLNIKGELRGLGGLPRAESRGEGSPSGLCFASAQPHEITVNNKKIIGSAQRRIKNKILQHGSILIDLDFETLAHCFKLKLNPEILRKSMTAINQETSKPIPLQKIKTAFLTAFQNHFQ